LILVLNYLIMKITNGKKNLFKMQKKQLLISIIIIMHLKN